MDHLELTGGLAVEVQPNVDNRSAKKAKAKAKAKGKAKAKAKQDGEIDAQREIGGQSLAAALDFEPFLNGELLKRLTSKPPPPKPPGRARRAKNDDPDTTFKLAKALVLIDQVPEPEAASSFSGQVHNKMTCSDIILCILDQVK
ncbi:hypothetical protein IF1G_09663 [Cordyceps javanica]|uniref:Uncharacterized protein n=1 Tax=Cordyceps javanica TaxID=43265 RepID=A0A545UQ52_9HYPO|nr:hypothetical protein IF1G_09663 [Cordyceps javanica]